MQNDARLSFRCPKETASRLLKLRKRLAKIAPDGQSTLSETIRAALHVGIEILMEETENVH